MNRRNWISCCAVWSVLALTDATNGQSEDSFGENEKSAIQAAEVVDGLADKSLLAAGLAVDEAAGAADFCRCIGDTESEPVIKIKQALRGPLRSGGLEFVDQPLDEVVGFLQEEYEIPVHLDIPSLDEIGIGSEEPVTVNLRNISLQSALRLMLNKLGLTYVVRDEVLLITTPEEAEAKLITCVYDVKTLLPDNSDKSADALIDTVVSCVATETWAENGGGEAEIRLLKPGLLVVAQTQAVQSEVRGLLTELREMRQNGPAPADAAIQAEPSPGEPLVTRSYVLQISRTDKADNLSEELRELVVKSLPDERWTGRLDDGQAVVLTVLPDRIVLRHKPAVHEAVEALLMESGVAAPAEPAAVSRMRPTNGGRMMGRAEGGGGYFQTDPARE